MWRERCSNYPFLRSELLQIFGVIWSVEFYVQFGFEKSILKFSEVWFGSEKYPFSDLLRIVLSSSCHSWNQLQAISWNSIARLLRPGQLGSEQCWSSIINIEQRFIEIVNALLKGQFAKIGTVCLISNLWALIP